MKPVELLACPECKSNLKEKSNLVYCQNLSCARVYKKEGNIYSFMGSEILPDVKLSVEKWDDFYQERDDRRRTEEVYQTYLRDNFENNFWQISEYKKFDNDVIFLEIGCGPMYFARKVAQDCKLVVGIDFSLRALKVAEAMLDQSGVKNYLLLHGDVNKIPLKSESVDIVYGGGVIEHFKDTFTAIKECARVLKKRGICFNTVPMLNIGSVTYRQVWGNIPNFPVLKQIAELVHIKLLRGRHMIFGYEFSFLPSTLVRLHKRAGFKRVEVKQYPTKLMFDFVPFKFLRNIFTGLANTSPLFWPMVKVVGYK